MTETNERTGLRIAEIHNQHTGAKDLNEEYVVIAHEGRLRQVIAGYEITDQTAQQEHVHIYTLPDTVYDREAGSLMAWAFDPGELLLVMTGSGRDEFFPATADRGAQYHCYMNRRAFVWNNEGDRVYLRRPDGTFAAQPFPVPGPRRH